MIGLKDVVAFCSLSELSVGCNLFVFVLCGRLKALPKGLFEPVGSGLRASALWLFEAHGLFVPA